MPSPQPAAMLIRVSDPTVLPALIGDLEQRAHHYVVKQTGPDTLAVSVLGSFKDGGEPTSRFSSWHGRPLTLRRLSTSSRVS